MKKLTAIILLLAAASSHAQRVDYSVVFVPEESGNNITRISTAGDYVCLPLVSRNAAGIKWLSVGYSLQYETVTKTKNHFATIGFAL